MRELLLLLQLASDRVRYSLFIIKIYINILSVLLKSKNQYIIVSKKLISLRASFCMGARVAMGSNSQQGC